MLSIVAAVGETRVPAPAGNIVQFRLVFVLYVPVCTGKPAQAAVKVHFPADQRGRDTVEIVIAHCARCLKRSTILFY